MDDGRDDPDAVHAEVDVAHEPQPAGDGVTADGDGDTALQARLSSNHHPVPGVDDLTVPDLAQQGEAAAGACELDDSFGASDSVLADAVARFSLESAGAAFGEEEDGVGVGGDDDAVLLSASVDWDSGQGDSEPNAPLAPQQASPRPSARHSQPRASGAAASAAGVSARASSGSQARHSGGGGGGAGDGPSHRRSAASLPSPHGPEGSPRHSTLSTSRADVSSPTLQQRESSAYGRPLSARSTPLGTLAAAARQRESVSERTLQTPPTPPHSGTPSSSRRNSAGLTPPDDAGARDGNVLGPGSSGGTPPAPPDGARAGAPANARRAASMPPAATLPHQVSPSARPRAGTTLHAGTSGGTAGGGGGASPSSSLPPEVAALHAFLDRTGGPCGGWDSRDHAVFRRLATSLGGVAAAAAAASASAGGDSNNGGGHPPGRSLVDAVMAALPGLYTRPEVEAHAVWDAQHEAMLAAKKDALARWKADKEAAAKAAAAQAAAAEEHRRRTDLQRAANERAARAAELEAWRAAQAQAALHEERLALESAAKAAAAARERKAKEAADMAARMAAVQAAKEQAQKAKEAEAAAAAEREKQRRKEVAAHAVAVRAQAEARVRAAEEARKAAQAVKQAAVRERQERVAKAAAASAAAIESRVSDDPRRLLAPTAAQRSREQAAAEVMRGQGLGLESLTHRAVPTWRKGL